PVMITYCTVCRTGRAFTPVVDGKPENFRLMGMDHFNAMFQDASTGSWWRQVNGEAVAGPKTGSKLNEYTTTQMKLGFWLEQYPNSWILQTDSTFDSQYKTMKNYDE